MRFDEVELHSVAIPDVVEAPPASGRRSPAAADAPLFRRFLALTSDLSLFVALALALSPLLPAGRDSISVAALAGFVLLTSYYYFVGAWLLWGKTIGGAIFDVRVVEEDADAMSVRSASLRWIGICLSLLIGGSGFIMAALPDGLSLPDRLSRTRSVAIP